MSVQVQGQTASGSYIANVDSNGNLYVTLANSDIGGLAMVGTLTHNSAAPAASSQVGVLPAVASSGAPSYNAGDQVLLSTDLGGNTRVVLNAETTKVIGTVNVAASQTIAVTNTGTFAVQAACTAASAAFVDGSIVTLGSKADAKSTATDTTAITIMQVLKEISYMEQNPVSRAVTNAGTFAVQAACTVASGGIASGAIASGAIAAGAIASGAAVSGAFADGSLVTLGSKADAKSTATDTTAITVMQVLKEISFMAQNPASVAVTNAGTFAVQATQAGTWTVGISAAQTLATVTTVGTVTSITNTVTTSSVPTTTGGCSTAVSQALTTTVNVKGSAGQLYGYTISNPNNTPAYCEYYNTATTPGTIGSTTNLLLEIMIPAGGTANMEWSNGIAFSSGIAVAVATTATGNTAPGIGLTITTIYK